MAPCILVAAGIKDFLSLSALQVKALILLLCSSDLCVVYLVNQCKNLN